MTKTKVAIIGSGNIGTDLMYKITRLSDSLEVVAMVGIDPSSDGLARAERLGVGTIASGVDGLLADSLATEIEMVFDATSARAHIANVAALDELDVQLIDLTPAAIGPYVVPTVNLHEHVNAPNVNMVTCGGQATIPIVAAISAVAPTVYAEIVASIASRSAGPGTRANIDEFTETTARAIERVGGVERGKAIIVLNPGEPPLIMRDTVFCIVEVCDKAAVEQSVHEMVSRVQDYVPGYRLKQDVQFRQVTAATHENDLIASPGHHERTVVTVMLEVEGAGHYLPPYAGNLDIMTSAARRVGELMAKKVTV